MSKILKVFENMSKDDILNLCNEVSSKSELFKKLQLSDNSSNWRFFNKLINDLDITLIFKLGKPIKYCLNCGHELNNNLNKFCCYSCATTYNNLHRDKSIYIKIGETLKLKYPKSILDKQEYKNKLEKEKIIKYCPICGNKLKNGLETFCSKECSNINKEQKHYNYYINNLQEFCRSNFVPRTYIRNEILKELNYKCDICNCNMEHNNKPLVFVLDHIDGNAGNNYRNNLRMICPNCDSLLPTFKSKNKNSSRRDYFRDKIKNDTIEKIKSGEIII